MAVDALVKPSVNSLTVVFDGSAVSGSNCTLDPFVMVVVGHKLNIQADLIDVTNGVDTTRRYAKSGLVEGRLVCTGYMVNGTQIKGAEVIDDLSGTGATLTMDYGNSIGTKSWKGFLESIEVNANKSQPFVGVAVSFKLSGAVT